MANPRNEKKPAAASASPEKNNKGLKPSGGSPPSGRKSKADILKSKANAKGWYLRSALLQGGLEIIMVTNHNMTDDGYFQPIITKLNEGSDTESICQLGLLGVYYMRISLTNPRQLMNGRTKYQRRAFVRVLDPGEETDENRLVALRVVKENLEKYENNKYGTPVVILEPGWNLTASLEELPKTDNYLQYAEIVKIIKQLFEGVDSNWATTNVSAAECFFHEGYIPYQAVQDLGFPESNVMTIEASIGI